MKRLWTNYLLICIVFVICTGCGAINVGKWRGVQFSPSDEKYYLVKDVFLSPGSAFGPKDSFDHALNESINLIFTPNNERNKYIAESVWFDPNGQEFRKVRTTYDMREESKKDVDRPKAGAMRIHTLPTKMLADHKSGMWKVALYIDDTLVRRLNFFVR